MPGQRLRQALSAFISRDPSEPAEEFLARHEELRDLLEPMLSQPEPDAESAPPTDPAWAERLEMLGVDPAREPRYRIEQEIARGGMGAIHLVWEEGLRRHLAMKVLLPRGCSPATGASIQLERFLEEAQVTAQLSHPGIVPVHGLGMDPEGRPFFTMELVRGRTLTQIYELYRRGEESWSLFRTLEVLIKVCDTLAYAHSRGVIHRDLKPANIMVGHHGEVYVMDWGVAKVLGREDHCDVHPTALFDRAERIRSDRSEQTSQTPDTPIATLDGTAIGTPNYMSPEQAAGHVAKMGPRSDIYTAGAMLYELLGGRPPYEKSAAAATPNLILQAVKQGPPTPLEELAPSAPVELIAICERAMAREPAQRYESADALGEDLRSFLEHRVVLAHRTGPVAELRKWIERNRALATTLATAATILLAGAIFFTLNLAAARTRAEEGERAAGEKAAEAAHNLEIVLDLSQVTALEDLEYRANEELWPAQSKQIAPMRRWIAEAEKMKALLGKLRANLAELRTRVLPYADEERGRGWIEQHITELVHSLETFIAGPEPAQGVLGIYGSSLPEVRRRLTLAEGLAERSLLAAQPAALWAQAIADIARPDGPYKGLVELKAIEGLVPLERNPLTGLWEFWHVPSGERPELNPQWKAEQPPLGRTADQPNRWIIKGATGMVFVLIPGGSFWMGAQKNSQGRPGYDPGAENIESPCQEVDLGAYLISKYETTQGQWRRIVGRNPAYYKAEEFNERVHWDNPVESVTWSECATLARRLGLTLPTEAQWEFACRAGTDTPWWCGADKKHLRTCANLADRSCYRSGPKSWILENWNDGHPVHSPVGSYQANPLGLHDMHGNVWEWCLDFYGSYGAATPRPGDGLRKQPEGVLHVSRGGGFSSRAILARSAYRSGSSPGLTTNTQGVRFVHTLP